MFVLWCRWRYGGEDPFEAYHDGAAANPPYPARIAAVRAGFALHAHHVTMKSGGGLR
jgi:hypothetical protein